MPVNSRSSFKSSTAQSPTGVKLRAQTIRKCPGPTAQTQCALAPPTCPAVVCVGIQIIQALQVLCVDDSGPWCPLHQLPQWAHRTCQAWSVFPVRQKRMMGSHDLRRQAVTFQSQAAPCSLVLESALLPFRKNMQQTLKNILSDRVHFHPQHCQTPAVGGGAYPYGPGSSQVHPLPPPNTWMSLPPEQSTFMHELSVMQQHTWPQSRSLTHPGRSSGTV